MFSKVDVLHVLHPKQHSSTFNADIGKTTQLCSTKADIIDSCKNGEQCHSSHCFWCEKAELVFTEEIFSKLTCNGCIIVIYKWIFNFFSVLILNTVSSSGNSSREHTFSGLSIFKSTKGSLGQRVGALLTYPFALYLFQLGCEFQEKGDVPDFVTSCIPIGWTSAWQTLTSVFSVVHACKSNFSSYTLP